jgi:transcription termination factor NusB
MKEIRDLETHIYNLWTVKEQVHTLLWRYMDHPEEMTENEMANQLLAIECVLDLYCEKIFDEYKQIAQLDEYATEEAKEYRKKLFKKVYKKKKDIDIEGRC